MHRLFVYPRARLRSIPSYSIVWGVFAAALLAVVAAWFTIGNWQNLAGLVLGGSGIDLSFLWPVTTAAAFLTELLVWYVLITRRARSDLRAAVEAGVVVGFVSHVPTAVGSWIWFPHTNGAAPGGDILLIGFASLLLAGWFTVPASVIVTGSVHRLARDVE